MKFLKLQYPKLNLLLLSYILTFLLYRAGVFHAIPHALNFEGYLAIVFAGFLFSFGFTTAAGIAIMVEVADQVHVIPAAILGGIGAMLMDLCILRFVRFSFQDEFERLRMMSFSRRIYSILHHKRISDRLREYLLWSVSGLVIASPLPDEVGITLLSGIQTVDTKKFEFFCFLMNTVGIAFILMTGKIV